MATSTTNGMIEEPSKDDVICGRGGKSNHYPGNIAFRAIIAGHHMEYLQCNRSKKTMMTVELLRGFRAAGVRFLRQADNINRAGQCYWLDVGDQLARTKISQALRDSTTVADVPTPAVTTSSNNDDDDQPVAVDTKRKKRKPVAPLPGCAETNRNPKRVLHDTIFHELPTPTITTAPSAATLSSSSTRLREVSPVPSRTGSATTTTTTGDCLFVPSLEVSGPSLQQPYHDDGEQGHDFPLRTTNNSGGVIGEELRVLYHVSPMEATLFELLEGNDNNNDKFSSIAVSSTAVSQWSVGGGGCTRLLLDRHNPFVLPDLPSRDDAPLRLPSIGVKIWDDDVDDNHDQCRPPREVSPISFDAIPSLQKLPADGLNGNRRRRSWIPATFALLNEDLSDVITPKDHDDGSDFVLGPHVVKSDHNHPVLSPSRHPEPCTNDDEDGDGWTCSITFRHDDDNDDLDDDNTPTTTSTFARATFSAFLPFTTSTTAGNWTTLWQPAATTTTI